MIVNKNRPDRTIQPIWGGKVRLVALKAPEDVMWLKETSLYDSFVQKYLLHAEDVSLYRGHSFCAAYTGDTLLAMCVSDLARQCVLYTHGRLYFRGRRLGAALRGFAELEWKN